MTGTGISRGGVAAVPTTGGAGMDFDWGPILKQGGVAGVVFAILAGLAKAIAWLLNWNQARELGHSAELRAREKAVTARELAFAAKLEARLAETEQRVAAAEQRAAEADERSSLALQRLKGLRKVTVDVMVELGEIAPASAVLSRAKDYLRDALREAFPADPNIPDDFTDLVHRLEELE